MNKKQVTWRTLHNIFVRRDVGFLDVPIVVWKWIKMQKETKSRGSTDNVGNQLIVWRTWIKKEMGNDRNKGESK